ncbi:MAG: phosphoglucosamine mutase [Defluviitaleaceae bacterium]|nr:phosphoglucosamine mutase [Defluviitaleaceae bacterium]
MMKLFGTDGVRGVANSELTPELAFYLGYGLVKHLGGPGRFSEPARAAHPGKPGVLIGMDTRRSGPLLEAALSAGIMSAGGDCYLAGELPTPAVALLVKKYSLAAGAVISASHNPFLDNGLKFFDSRGFKINDEKEDAIENIVHRERAGLISPRRIVGGSVGIRYDAGYSLRDYIAIQKSLAEMDLSGAKIVLDCANGAMYKAAPGVFSELGADICVINDKPTGENINLRSGSMSMESCVAAVRESGASVGFAFDGDGDRCLVVDELGNIIDGDQILSILAVHFKAKGQLAKNTVVSTVMSNIGFEKCCEDNGIQLIRTNVGDKHVFSCMNENGYILGGEQSGHIINMDYGTTGDGLSCALQLLRVMIESGEKISTLASVMQKYPQVIRNVRVSNERKDGYLTSTVITEAISALEGRLNTRGRVLIRSSGTEPLIRIMLEGVDAAEITKEAETLAELIGDVLA